MVRPESLSVTYISINAWARKWLAARPLFAERFPRLEIILVQNKQTKKKQTTENKQQQQQQQQQQQKTMHISLENIKQKTKNTHVLTMTASAMTTLPGCTESLLVQWRIGNPEADRRTLATQHGRLPVLCGCLKLWWEGGGERNVPSRVRSVQFCALWWLWTQEIHNSIRSHLSVIGFPSVAFQVVSMLVWLTMTFSHPLTVERSPSCLVLHFSPPGYRSCDTALALYPQVVSRPPQLFTFSKTANQL